MTTTEIHPAFDPTLQPIGYALAAELLTLAPPLAELPAAADLFGWELADTARPASAADAASDRATGQHRNA